LYVEALFLDEDILVLEDLLEFLDLIESFFLILGPLVNVYLVSESEDLVFVRSDVVLRTLLEEEVSFDEEPDFEILELPPEPVVTVGL